MQTKILGYQTQILDIKLTFLHFVTQHVDLRLAET